MNIKIFKTENKTDDKSENKIEKKAECEITFYENPKLIRRDGVYYIGYQNDVIQIEEWEAKTIYEHPEMVYDLIVSYRRKYYFNTAEDSPDFLFDN